MRLLARHPHLDAATTTGALTISWAKEIAAWTGRIDHDELQGEADKILIDAAAAGAGLDDLRLLAQAAYEAWRAQEPDPDDDPAGRGFADRDLLLDTTLDGAGQIRGDLTPECAAAVTAVLEALGKRRGPDDLRTIGQRYHDALQEGCELLIRAKMIPDRAGADTRVDVTIPLRDLLQMDGASVVEDTWLRARAGEHGYLTGRDAEAIACDALIVPVVTGSPDWDLITEMITLVTDAYNHASPKLGTPLPPEAWEALQYALARRAIRFVSGPGALASALRRSLLGKPLNTRSAILDVGYADTIPDAIRKAVIARDKGCAWPGGCDRRPAHCDVHHVKHKTTRRQNQQHRLLDALPVPSRRLHPPARLANRTPARRIHPRDQPRPHDHPPQPRATTHSTTQRLAPTPPSTRRPRPASTTPAAGASTP